MRTTNPMQRRLRFSLLIMVSQILLVALAISWIVHMVFIAVEGSVYFVENNPFILWAEIGVSVLIAVLAMSILITMIIRLGERRNEDRSRD